MQIIIIFFVFDARKIGRSSEIDRLGVYDYTDKGNNETGTGIDYRKVIVNGVNEGREQELDRFERGDADRSRQRILLGRCNSLRRVVTRTKKDRDKETSGRW